MRIYQTSRRASRAFNSIELLVIVAIFVALAGLRLAALSRASARTQLIQDISNFKNIMAAMQLYTSDNREVLPRPGWGVNMRCWAAGGNPDPNMPMSFSPPGAAANYPTVLSQQLNYVKNGQLWPYLKSYKVLMCPADGPGKEPSFYNRPVIVTSYVWNGAIIGYPALSDSLATPIFKLTNPRFKADAVLQWEQYAGLPYAFNDFASFPSEGIASRHGKIAPIGMFGGGAEVISYARWYQFNSPGNRGAYDSFACCGVPNSGSANNTAPNRAWCSPLTSNGH